MCRQLRTPPTSPRLSFRRYRDRVRVFKTPIEGFNMSESSPSNGSGSSPSLAPSTELLSRPPIKRARPQLSCTPCRQGKLKCNREHPVCDQCAKRSRQDACQYVPPPPRNKQAQNMRGRIRNLESLVVNLINQKASEQDETTASAPKTNPRTEKEARAAGIQDAGAGERCPREAGG